MSAQPARFPSPYGRGKAGSPHFRDYRHVCTSSHRPRDRTAFARRGESVSARGNRRRRRRELGALIAGSRIHIEAQTRRALATQVVIAKQGRWVTALPRPLFAFPSWLPSGRWSCLGPRAGLGLDAGAFRRCCAMGDDRAHRLFRRPQPGEGGADFGEKDSDIWHGQFACYQSRRHSRASWRQIWRSELSENLRRSRCTLITTRRLLTLISSKSSQACRGTSVSSKLQMI